LSRSVIPKLTFRPGRAFGALSLSVLLIVLAGCTAGWRAPMETRGDSRVSTAPARSAPAPATSAAIGNAAHYRVRRGDTLYAIAWRSNNDFRDLAGWNRISPPYTIYVGQVLRLKPPPAARPQRRDKPPAATPRVAAATPKNVKPKTPARSEPKKVAQAPPRNAQLAWQWPAPGRITSSFKAGDALRKGIKLDGRPGDPVRAAEAGKVVYSGSGLIGYGRLIIVKHNEKYLSAYGHNRKLLVRQGQQVTKGQKIAELGRANDGQPLLHFEIRRDGKPVNPVALLPRR